MDGSEAPTQIPGGGRGLSPLLCSFLNGVRGVRARVEVTLGLGAPKVLSGEHRSLIPCLRPVSWTVLPPCEQGAAEAANPLYPPSRPASRPTVAL